jgi:type VI protein secretion system component Hcp
VLFRSEDSDNIGVNKRTSVILTKSMDNASCDIFDLYTEAASIPEVEFHHIVGNDDKCRYQVNFKNVRIHRYDTHAFADGVLEEIEFTFMTHENRIMPTDATGKLMPAKSAGFNFINMTRI